MPSPLAPRFWPVHLLALAAVALAGWLGVWQWHAWEAHREAAARDLTAVDPIPLAEALGRDDPFPGDMVGQPVVVDGTWVPGGTVYVTGRQDDGRDGVWAVTPLAVDGAVSPALYSAIRRFQVASVKMSKPDGRVDPGEDVGLFSFVHEDSSRGIDDLVVARKKAVKELGGFRFLSEERFFLSTGRYRAASLSLFEGGRAGQPTFVASLFCDSERGTIEVYGWTTRVGTLEALRQAVLGLRLDGE